MWPFKRKANPVMERVLNFFKIEEMEPGTVAFGDYSDKDFLDWLRFIHGVIQNAIKNKTIDGEKIENYVSLQDFMRLGGQRLDLVIVKDGCKGPHELLQELKSKKEEAK
jgi:uncharacterized protein (DUF2461 family)